MEELAKNFLKKAVGTKNMTLYLINGIRLIGTIIEMGDESLIIRSKTQISGEQLVFIRHISTISEYQESEI